jgi:hypothetical protein
MANASAFLRFEKKPYASSFALGGLSSAGVGAPRRG